MTGTVTYLYAVTGSDPVIPVDELAGIDGAPVTAIDTGELTALASEVSVAALRNLPEHSTGAVPDWLAAAVQAHDAVAVHALRHATVLPMRFGSVYPDQGAVAATLDRHRDRLLTELRRLAGCTEWTVTVQAAAATGSEVHTAPPVAGAGTTFLRARQAELQAERTRRDQLAACTDDLLETLRGTSRELVVSRGQTIRLSCLVSEVETFHAALTALRSRHRTPVRVTGPWPPYHFTGGLFDARPKTGFSDERPEAEDG